MAAPKLAQAVAKVAKFLTAYRSAQIAASGTGVEVARIVVPFRFELHRIDYDLTVAGSSGTVTDLVAKVGSTEISEKVAPAAGAGAKNGSLRVLTPLTAYAPGTVVSVIATTAANTTIDRGGLTFTTVMKDSV